MRVETTCQIICHILHHSLEHVVTALAAHEIEYIAGFAGALCVFHFPAVKELCRTLVTGFPILMTTADTRER
jgi:hypothetical protein